MKSTLLLYLFSIIFACVAGGGYVWSILFSVPVGKSSESLPTHVAMVVDGISKSRLVTLDAPKLWNLTNKKDSIVTTRKDDKTSFYTVELGKDGWVLEDEREPGVQWHFCGVIRMPEGLTAIFYNKDKKWFLAQQQDMFMGLRLVRMSAEEIVLLDTTADKEWRLGLFDLKYNTVPEKEK